jgi:hypothetical protein
MRPVPPRRVIGQGAHFRRPAEQLPRLVVTVRGAVLAADGHKHLRAVCVRLLVLAFDDRCGAPEQLAGGERLARRRGVGEQESIEVVGRFRARELTQREVPLLGGGARLQVGAPGLLFRTCSLSCGALGFGDRTGKSGQQGDDSVAGSATGKWVAART